VGAVCRIGQGGLRVGVPRAFGPRILELTVDGAELFFVDLDLGRGDWRLYGGHRLWAAPEGDPCYAADNEPVTLELMPDGCCVAAVDAAGMEKQLRVRFDQGLHVEHTLVNRGPTRRIVAAWALSAFRGGEGRIPREPYVPHGEALLPSGELVLWPYTDLRDPRFDLGREHIGLRAGPGPAQKIGAHPSAGWAEWVGPVTVRKHLVDPGIGTWPDRGASHELYTEGALVEVETLGPLRALDPGEALHLTEWWELR
jgi:hypothetical protein